jgi:hypothetical protein
MHRHHSQRSVMFIGCLSVHLFASSLVPSIGVTSH